MFKPFIQNYTAVVVLSGICFQPVAAFAAGEDNQMEEVVIYGEQKETDTATNLDLTIFDTPQTVTAVSRLQMDEFLLDKANQVLDYTPGVSVEEVETHRTYYTARGFDITNFQYDGIGTPFAFGLVQGQADTAIYEKIEVVKGAAGLITGLANPSATINFVRKRPTDGFQAGTRVSANEWSGLRVDGDVSGSLSDSIRGRAVIAAGDSESYLDRLEESTSVFYGVLEFDLSDNTLLTVGYSYDSDEADGILWGALPLTYFDGTPTDYDVSTSTSANWSFRNTEDSKSFVELKHMLNDQWTLNAIYSQTKTDIDSELFYVDGAPQLDESGLGAYTGRYLNGADRNMIDLNAIGYITVAGREHQLVVGYSQSDVEITGAGFLNLTTGYPALGTDWADGNTPRPDFIDDGGFSDVEQTHKSFYAATRISITDQLSALVGARSADYEQRGENYGGDAMQDADKTVPYFGLTYQITDVLMAYGSYSEVFSPQVFVDPDLSPLGPIEGESTELGLKVSLNNERAVLTLAAFESQIGNYGVYVGDHPTAGVATYDPRNQESDGYEIELTGQLSGGLNISAGYTKVDIEDATGGPVLYVPEQTLKASASYSIPAIPQLKIGGVLKWQDDVTTASGVSEQKAYSLLELMAQYDITEQMSVAVNIENITDEKYLNSLYWEQGYYGAPRNFSFSANWKF